MTTLRGKLAALFNLRRGELAPVLVAGLFFFCLLTALMMLRPARDALGMERGIESIRWLFVGTALATLLVNPVFGWLVSRFRRLQFVGATYGFFALSLVGFWALIVGSALAGRVPGAGVAWRMERRMVGVGLRCANPTYAAHRSRKVHQ